MIHVLTINQIIALIMFGIALVFIFIGIYGSYKYDNFYARILVASKVDTVGFITLMLGVVVYKGFSSFSLKVFLLMCFMMIINPLSTHLIARSAYKNGVEVRKK